MCVRKMKDGRWYISFRFKDQNGVIKQKKKTGFKLKTEAIEWKKIFFKQLNKKNCCFETLLESFLQDLKIRCKATTYKSTKSLIYKWILPIFKDTNIHEISLIKLRKWQNDLIENKELKATTKHKVNSKFSTLLNYAVSYFDLNNNPFTKLRLSIYDEDKTHVSIWNYEEYKQFRSFVAANEKFKNLVLMFDILYFTGIRRGELLALRYQDLDLANKIIFIRANRTDGKGGLSTTKTKNSQRTVLIPDFLVNCLTEYILNNNDGESELLFQTYTPSKLSYNFKIIQQCCSEKLNLPRIRLHDLRHSHASLLLDMGISYQAVAERLGHSNVQMVIRTYAHLFAKRKTEVVDKLNTLTCGDINN